MRIAVIGTGIAGSSAAWTLARHHEVIVYERDLRPGGHTHTVDIHYGGERLAVDTGFIVFNQVNYPELTALFARLGVETLESCMSFSVSADRGRFEWAGGGATWSETASGLFAQPRNVLSLSYLRMLAHIVKFNNHARRDLASGALAGLTLGQYFEGAGFSPRLLRDYLAPMGAAIWSAPSREMLDFPAENFVAFFDNHRLLQYDRPTWRTVKGGSRTYVEKLLAPLRGQVRLGHAVTSIARTPLGVVVRDTGGHTDMFDHVVIASHTDQTLGMLSDATHDERNILGAIRYRPNDVYLHRDERLMPKRRRAWASWNFLNWPREDTPVNDMSVTYWMNRLQGIPAEKPLFVSLNPPFLPDPDKTFGRYLCDHPQYDRAAFEAQKRLATIQGVNRTWFCGAWTGYGFHEDGLRSGLAAARALGAEAPWRAPVFSEAAE